MQLLILCGGRGKRLRPFTDEIPKPLLEIHGKPIIEYQIDFFRRHGIEDIILCSGYKHELFKEKYPELTHSIEKEGLGTAGAIKNAKKLIKGDFIVTNGDNIFSFNFRKMLKKFEDVKNPLLALTRLVSPYGIVELEGERVVSFKEKPELNHWINAGITIFTYESLDYFPEVGSLEYDVYPKLAKDRKLFAFKMMEGFWLAVDTPKDLERAKELLVNLK